MALVWTILAFVVVVLFLFAVVWWDRRTGPSTTIEKTPSQPPADAGAEGMRVPEPGDITTGPDSDGG